MKKIAMTFAAAMMATVMSAQVYVGGSAGISSESYDGNSRTLVTIKPEVGYNINDNWAIGMSVGYAETGKKKNDNKLQVFTINPYARYTFVKFDKVNLFVDGAFQYTYTKDGGDNIGYEKTNEFSWGLKPGVAVNLNDKVSFVSHVGFFGYTYEKVKGADKGTNYLDFGIDASNIDFGVYFNF